MKNSLSYTSCDWITLHLHLPWALKMCSRLANVIKDQFPIHKKLNQSYNGIKNTMCAIPTVFPDFCSITDVFGQWNEPNAKKRWFMLIPRRCMCSIRFTRNSWLSMMHIKLNKRNKATVDMSKHRGMLNHIHNEISKSICHIWIHFVSTVWLPSASNISVEQRTHVIRVAHCASRALPTSFRVSRLIS